MPPRPSLFSPRTPDPVIAMTGIFTGPFRAEANRLQCQTLIWPSAVNCRAVTHTRGARALVQDRFFSISKLGTYFANQIRRWPRSVVEQTACLLKRRRQNRSEQTQTRDQGQS